MQLWSRGYDGEVIAAAAIAVGVLLVLATKVCCSIFGSGASNVPIASTRKPLSPPTPRTPQSLTPSRKHVWDAHAKAAPSPTVHSRSRRL